MSNLPETIRIPERLLPEGVQGSSFSPDILKSAAEIHCRHRFAHDMQVKAWVILFLLEKLEDCAKLEIEDAKFNFA